MEAEKKSVKLRGDQKWDAAEFFKNLVGLDQTQPEAIEFDILSEETFYFETNLPMNVSIEVQTNSSSLDVEPYRIYSPETFSRIPLQGGTNYKIKLTYRTVESFWRSHYFRHLMFINNGT